MKHRWHFFNSQLGYIFLEDVTGIKTHTSHIVIQNGDLCQKKKTNDSAVKYPLTQESQHLTENDGLPEEVSFLNT